MGFNELKSLLLLCRKDIEDSGKPLNENERAFVDAIGVSVGEVVADATACWLGGSTNWVLFLGGVDGENDAAFWLVDAAWAVNWTECSFCTVREPTSESPFVTSNLSPRQNTQEEHDAELIQRGRV